jgi:excisionase family DNA binding protein
MTIRNTDAARTDRSFHTVQNIADRWDVSAKSVRRMIKSGKLIAHRFGRQHRVSDEDLEACEKHHRDI